MELVNYPGYKIYPDGRIWSDKTNDFMKPDKKGVFTLQRKWEQKGVKLTTLQYEQNNICKYDNIIHTLFMNKPTFIFQCKVKGVKNKIFEKRFKSLEEALLYKYIFIMKVNLLSLI